MVILILRELRSVDMTGSIHPGNLPRLHPDSHANKPVEHYSAYPRQYSNPKIPKSPPKCANVPE